LREFVALNNVCFSTVVIDEAAQSMESGCLSPLLYGCERLVLIGDQNQLPPVITSPQAAVCGLGVSLFSRLCVAGLKPAMLKQQYRSHPAIANLVSERFYQSQIVSETTAESRPPPKYVSSLQLFAFDVYEMRRLPCLVTL
jgi:regulator of nonsense transcripts 1